MINLCTIDGQNFDELVTAIEETYTITEGANSGIALEYQRELRDISGIKIGHKITFDADKNPALFDDLTNYLFGAIRPYVLLEAAHNQNVISYEAAYNTGSRRVAHIDDENDTIYWTELTIEFRPIENQINAE